MPLDFYVQSKDTGFNSDEAIQPVTNGEDASQAVFRRPSENLRTRSEDIRKQFDLLEAVVASDRGLTIMAASDAYVSWDATAGTFDITDEAGTGTRDLYIVPLSSTAEGPSGTPPGSHIPAKYVYVGSGVTPPKFSIQAHPDLRDHGDAAQFRRSGANNLFFELRLSSSTPAGSPAVSVEGDSATGLTFPEDGPVTIVVTINDAGETTSNIVAALSAAGDHDTYIDTSNVVELVSGTCTVAKPRTRFGDGGSGDYDAGEQSMGAIDPEGIKITAGTFSSFFSNTDNRLTQDGDAIVVNFTGAADRLNNQTDVSVGGLLQKLQRNTVMAARRHVVPVCKRFGDNLYFLNGAVFRDGVLGRLVLDPGDLTDFQAVYNAHVAGTADNHAVKDITNRPTVIVDASGNGDYTDIAAAISAYAATSKGARILVRDGVYSGTYTGSIQSPIDVIGVEEGVEWQATAASLLQIQSTDTWTGYISFYNLTFRRPNGTTDTQIAVDGSSAENAKITFKNCQFIDENQSATTWTQFAGCRVTVENCAFLSPNVPTYRTIAVKTAGDAFLSVRNCHFQKCGQIWKADATDKMVSFTDNYIDGCGYTVNGSDVGWLFEGGSYHHDVVVIRDNRITGFASQTNQALFAWVEPYSGVVENNYYENSQTLVSPTTIDYCIKVSAHSTNCDVTVANNLILPGDFSGIEAKGTVKIIGNTLRDFGPGYTYGYGVRSWSSPTSTGGIIRENTIWGNATANHNGIVAEDAHTLIEGNTVGNLGTAAKAIHVTGENSRVIGNRIDNIAAADAAIYIAGAKTVCSGNTIANAKFGIYVIQDAVTIVGNVISLGADGTCITMTSATRNTVAGNTLYGTTGSTGIQNASDFNVVSGNTIYGCLKGIDLTAGTKFSCTNNVIYVPEVASSKGIDAARGASTAIYGAIVGNTINRGSDSLNTGSYGIDVSYCDKLEVTGNSIWPHPGFEQPIATTGAAGVGTGKNNTMPNTDTYNTFDESV